MDKKAFVEYVKEQYERNPNGQFDRSGREYIENGRFDIEVRLAENTDLSWSESYLGTSFGSTQDYGDTYKSLKSGDTNEQDLIDDVRERILRSPRQTNFVKKNDDREVIEVYTGVVVVVRQNGYAIYPNPESTVEV